MPGGAPNPHNLWTANADGSGPRQITNEQGDVLDYAAAPDGSRIAYVVRESQQATSLWAINLDGTGRIRLSPANDPSLYASPAWSPAGDVIVYTLRSVVPSGARPSISAVDGAAPSGDDWHVETLGGRAGRPLAGAHLRAGGRGRLRSGLVAGRRAPRLPGPGERQQCLDRRPLGPLRRSVQCSPPGRGAASPGRRTAAARPSMNRCRTRRAVSRIAS